MLAASYNVCNEFLSNEMTSIENLIAKKNHANETLDRLKGGFHAGTHPSNGGLFLKLEPLPIYRPSEGLWRINGVFAESCEHSTNTACFRSDAGESGGLGLGPGVHNVRHVTGEHGVSTWGTMLL